MPAVRPPRPSDVDAAPSVPLLKSNEIAALLRVHPKQIYRLLDQGLPARRVGSEWRFVRDEVLAWSEGRSAGTNDPRPAAKSSSLGPPPLLAANGDVVVEILLRLQRESGRPLVGLVQTDAEGALTALRDEQVLFAGFHGETPPSYLDDVRIARLQLGSREVGLAVPGKVPLATIDDLAGRRLAGRPSTAGIRGHLDRALERAGLSLARLRTKLSVHPSHVETIAAIARGEADVALTSAGWARRFGLAFLPLAREPYDILLRAAHLGHPAAVGLCETAQDPALRRALEQLGGYDATGAGAIRYSTGG